VDRVDEPALGLPSELVARGEFSEQGGASAADRLLDREPGPTAVYCSTLGQAVGALHAIRTRGLRVPADVSVVTYDDLPLAGYLDPPLTSVAMPLLELGAAAVDAVLQQLAGGPAADVAIRVPPAIVERGSVRRLP
jgi:LacI family transcriptional regulator